MGIKTPTLADTIVSNKGRYYGAGDRTRFAFLPFGAEIKVPLRPAAAGNAHPRCI